MAITINSLMDNVFVLTGQITQNKWENLNPGAGGQIQDINPDPNIPDRVYYNSDMEGSYVTDDGGNSWKYIGTDLSDSYMLTIAVEYGNSNRIYAGSRSGIDISDDAGTSWRKVLEISNEPIMCITINPKNNNQVIAGPGERWRWEKNQKYPNDKIVGIPGVWISNDRGMTWNYSPLQNEFSRREVFSIDFSPRQEIYVGAFAGIFVSENGGIKWKKIINPPKTGACFGVCLSPDASRIYAIFQLMDKMDIGVQKNNLENTNLKNLGFPTGLFMTDTSNFKWISLNNPNKGYKKFWNDESPEMYWKPKMDQYSTKYFQKLLTASFSNRTGLYEISVEYNEDGELKNYTWNNVLFYTTESKVNFDIGWEKYWPRPLSWFYSPTSWKKREIWTTGDQTLFKVNTSIPNYENKWENIYCKFISEIDETKTYSTRGANSTFVFDVAAYKNYVIQCNADNGIIESWDNGHSWALANGPSGSKNPRSNSAIIMTGLTTPIVIAHTAEGFGGTSSNGILWGKKLSTFSPKDKWLQLAGGKNWKKVLLPNKLYVQMIQDNNNPRQLIIGTNDSGIFIIKDIEELFLAVEKNSVFPEAIGICKRSRPPKPMYINEKGGALFQDPDDPFSLWICSKNIVYKANRMDNDWSFEKIREFSTDFTPYIYIWKNEEGKKIIAMTVPGGNGSQHCSVEISNDNGKSWTSIVSFEKDIKHLKKFSWFTDDIKFDVTGLTAYKNNVFLSFSSRKYGAKSYGIFKGTCLDELWTWTDFTDNLQYPFPVRAKIIKNENDVYIYVCTWGNGLWRRKIE